MEHRLTEKWIKASIAGTIWAASEIVLGSFLHNLRVPFSGNILTAIGIVILIGISFKWTDKGLFWRAGIICALMKTMSPSAVIFGPMIAIIAESFLLELSVRLLGRTIAGYLAGAMLAVSWNLFQKIANYIIFYGANIIEVYNNLLRYAERELNTQTNLVWLPVIILLILFALTGLVAGLTGIYVGRKMLKEPHKVPVLKSGGTVNQIPGNRESGFKYSILWLFSDIALLIVSFILLGKTPWYVWSTTITLIIIIWSLRYNRALRQISKPGFWIFFVLITLITAFAFTIARSDNYSLKDALLTGIQMNFRAGVIVVGFSVLGTELYNPVVRDFFRRTSFRNLPLALELATESLPGFIANIPDFRSLMKDPVSIFYFVISQAERRFSEIRSKGQTICKIFIITGPAGKGKTNFTKRLLEYLRNKNIAAGGIISERIISDGKTTGYDVVDIATGEKEVFLRQHEKFGSESIGRFSINPAGIIFGKKILNSYTMSEQSVVVADEVGLLELRNGGWCDSLCGLLEAPGNNIILTVRDKFVDEVIRKFNIPDARVINIEGADPQTAAEMIYCLIIPKQ